MRMSQNIAENSKNAGNSENSRIFSAGLNFHRRNISQVGVKNGRGSGKKMADFLPRDGFWGSAKWLMEVDGIEFPVDVDSAGNGQKIMEIGRKLQIHSRAPAIREYADLRRGQKYCRELENDGNSKNSRIFGDCLNFQRRNICLGGLKKWVEIG